MRLSPTLNAMGSYPFVRLSEARRAAEAAGVDVIDFGMGEPREETPAFIREALAGAITPLAPYPTAVGLPELRGAIAGWAQRRFGATLDPDSDVIPTLGSKEAVFALANVFAGDVVAVPTPSYPVYERGAQFAGKRVLELPLTEANGWLPDLDAVDWTGVGVLWLNYPNNPTGARAPLSFYEHAATLARGHGFVLASDEAYSELYFAGEPPQSALQLADRSHVAVFNTLSKRSSMPGYRSGFAAGDPDLVAALKRYRPNVGTAPPTFVQRAAAIAWGDEAHVVETRARYAAKRDLVLPALRAVGLEPAGGDASFFLWLRVPSGGDAEAFALRLLDELGLVVAPGPFFGPGGEGHVRAALVPTLDECRRAAELLASWA